VEPERRLHIVGSLVDFTADANNGLANTQDRPAHTNQNIE
jgi:hypothetical protein